ncbi:leucine-rich repeat domain-containing protein [uncultured Aquimarina sp.]|uniref:leucine-rich repeat domain-containing protein n=1 Tax=uncultured Aquimarina sp. TaxID=575652 RepID=UPI002621879B|nr:leucine-rich repeat domain-containing protein [uncultured Aquimarina sp.]
MKKFEKSSVKNILSIDPFSLNEGVKYAISNNISSLAIKPLNAYAEYGFSDPKELYKIKLDTTNIIENKKIEELSFSDHINLSKNDIENLYTLENLKSLSFKNKTFKLDFCFLTQLEKLNFKYNKGVTNLNTLHNLKELLIISLSESNLINLSNLESLITLRLTRGNFISVEGIENLKIERLDINYNNKIKDINPIGKLSNLKVLNIEKCKQLTDFSFLKGNETIKELFVDNLDSIEFISSMPNLEKINFWFSKDGNMKPLLESKSLKQINFYPNKKHYSHTIEEIIETTGAQRGRNK